MKSKLIEKLTLLQNKKAKFVATAGFDAVTDVVVRLVRKKGDKTIYFKTIQEFGEYLISKDGMSCSIEMEIQREKLGGNMAIFSNGLGNLGITVECIGSFGKDKESVFYSQMNENCRLHSVCSPGQCNALEFQDGKVMLYSMDGLNTLDWENIQREGAEGGLLTYLKKSKLTALLNWGELPKGTNLFEKIYEHCMKASKQEKEKWILVDISDASSKTKEELLELSGLLRKISEKRTLILSVNENECRLFNNALGIYKEDSQQENIKRLGTYLGIDYTILHLRDCSYGYHNGEMVYQKGYYTEVPYISTGGGDNFNAGVSFGLVQGFSLRESLMLGNGVSGYYVRTGKSPNLQQLIEFLKTEESAGEDR